MDATEIIAELRAIRTTALLTLPYGASPLPMLRQIENLEVEIAGTDAEDFTCDVVGFDTVLSYLAKTNPEVLDLMPNPVHDTIRDGMIIAAKARARRLPVVKVAACEHMKRRFPKARYVNAYPTHLLVEYFG